MDIVEINNANAFRHPWEISKVHNIISLVLEQRAHGPFADVGSGDLYFARELKNKYGGIISAIDAGYASFKPADSGGFTILSSVGGLGHGTAGTAFLLDVLEHVADEAQFLSEVRNALAPGGRLIVSVPAFGFLFSGHDAFLKHKRRYSLNDLNETLQKSGFAVDNIFYFYFSLFFVRLAELVLEKFGAGPLSKKAVSNWKYPRENILTASLVLALNLDFKLCRLLSKFKINLPGLSLCAVSTKISS